MRFTFLYVFQFPFVHFHLHLYDNIIILIPISFLYLSHFYLNFISFYLQLCLHWSCSTPLVSFASFSDFLSIIVVVIPFHSVSSLSFNTFSYVLSFICSFLSLILFFNSISFRFKCIRIQCFDYLSSRCISFHFTLFFTFSPDFSR